MNSSYILREGGRIVGDFLYKNSEMTFEVSYRKAQSHHMPASHFHSTYEIYFLLSGQRTFFIQDRTIVASEGDVVIVAPNVLHRTTNAAVSEHERLIVNIDRSLIGLTNGDEAGFLQPLLEREYVFMRFYLHERQSVEELAHGMMQEMRERQPGFELYARALVQQLLVVCGRHIGRGSVVPLVSPSPMHERIANIVRYMNDHYMEDLSLQRVADRFYVSTYYLSRFFKEATGFSFVEYLNSVRVKEAKKLLEGSPMKVGAIARKVGFHSVTHFGRVFKLVTGYVPLYYRKRK